MTVILITPLIFLITPLIFTTIRSITSHITPGRVAKPSSDASIRAGFAAPAGRRRRALTFHRFNVLLKTPAEIREGPSGSPWGLSGRSESISLIAWHAEFIPFVRRLHRA